MYLGLGPVLFNKKTSFGGKNKNKNKKKKFKKRKENIEWGLGHWDQTQHGIWILKSARDEH